MNYLQHNYLLTLYMVVVVGIQRQRHEKGKPTNKRERSRWQLQRKQQIQQMVVELREKLISKAEARRVKIFIHSLVVATPTPKHNN